MATWAAILDPRLTIYSKNYLPVPNHYFCRSKHLLVHHEQNVHPHKYNHLYTFPDDWKLFERGPNVACSWSKVLFGWRNSQWRQCGILWVKNSRNEHLKLIKKKWEWIKRNKYIKITFYYFYIFVIKISLCYKNFKKWFFLWCQALFFAKSIQCHLMVFWYWSNNLNKFFISSADLNMKLM